NAREGGAVTIDAAGTRIAARVTRVVAALDASSRSAIVHIDLPGEWRPSPGLRPPSPRARGEGQGGDAPSPRLRGEGPRRGGEGRHSPLRSGTSVNVLFTTGARRAVAVPASAVKTNGALASVFVVGCDGIARLRL